MEDSLVPKLYKSQFAYIELKYALFKYQMKRNACVKYFEFKKF